jgi:hypothetical protein
LIEADDWLHGIRRRLELVKSNDKEGVNIATFQLRGIASAWWECFCAIHPDPANIGWTEFAHAFHEHHLMEGAMDAKAEEFRKLQMGTMTVREYTNKFIQLMRYVPEYTNTEKQRHYYYMKGLTQPIRSKLLGHDCPTLKQLINKANIVEMDLKEIDLEKEALRNEKRKRIQSIYVSSSTQRLKLVDRTLPGPLPPRAQGQPPYRPQVVKHHYPMGPISETSTESEAKCVRSKKKKKHAVVVCHTYHKIGHKAHVCP